MEKKPLNLLTPAIIYGKENESKAKTEDTNFWKSFNYKIQDTGLWVNPKYPGFSASPDALVYAPLEVEPFGLLEIKCPKILENLKPNKIYKLKKQQVYHFCSDFENGKLVLKRIHEYFNQIQTAMAIVERPWCDFMI